MAAIRTTFQPAAPRLPLETTEANAIGRSVDRDPTYYQDRSLVWVAWLACWISAILTVTLIVLTVL